MDLNELDAQKNLVFDLCNQSFEVSFDGYGDSGQIEEIDLPEEILNKEVKGVKISNGYTWKNGKMEEILEETNSLQGVIGNICYCMLEKMQSGWEINEGSFGTFKFDFETRKVTLDFNERYVESKQYEYTL